MKKINRTVIQKILRDEFEMLLAGKNVDDDVIFTCLGFKNYNVSQREIRTELRDKGLLDNRGNLNIKLKVPRLKIALVKV